MYVMSILNIAMALAIGQAQALLTECNLYHCECHIISSNWGEVHEVIWSLSLESGSGIVMSTVNECRIITCKST